MAMHCRVCLAILVVVYIEFATSVAAWAQAVDTNINRPIKDKWALVVGITKFADPGIPTLTWPAKDAQDFAEFLVTKANFAKDHVLLLTNENATRLNILDAYGVTWLPKRVQKDDLVVVYISSHGSSADHAEENYVVAYDSQLSRLFPTGIKLQDLAPEITRRTRCDRVVLILDACHSGAAADAAKGLNGMKSMTGLTGIKGITRDGGNFDVNAVAGVGTLVISSSRCNEVSWESARYSNSVFTKKLMEALLSNGAETKLGAAFQQLQETVEQEVKFDRPYPITQQPQISNKLWKGEDLVLASLPTRPRQVLPELPGWSVVASTPNAISAATTAATAASSTYYAAAPVVASTSASTSTPTSGVAGIAGGDPVLVGRVSLTTGLPDSVAFFSINPPKQYNVSASDAFPAITDDQRREMQRTPSLLQRYMRETLAAKLSNRMVPVQTLNNGLLSKSLGSPAAGRDYWKRLGQLVQAKYLIVGTISDFTFRGKVVTSNDYIMAINLSVVSGETGEVLWQQIGRRFKKSPWAGDMQCGFVSYLQKKVLPTISQSLCDEILTAVSRQR